MQNIKEKIGKAAAALVKSEMVIGLGTGSTAACFIHSLARRYHHEKLTIVTVSSSNASEALALELGLPCICPSTIDSIDITFDGADEIDPLKRMIKGAGGALLKEKIIATASKELVIMVDETKCVGQLGKTKLPVEVVPFGHHWTAKMLKTFALSCEQRMRDGKPFITDSHNFIYDVQFHYPIEKAEQIEQELLRIPGVVETGLFLNLAGRVIIGDNHGTIKTI